MKKMTCLLAVSLLALMSRAPAFAQGSAGSGGRAVHVRVYTGDHFDPKRDVAVGATTRSIREDQAWLLDSRNKNKGNAADLLEKERQEGYSESNLATMQEARLSAYMATNVPTHLCFCAGHVLVMAGSRVKSGPVPPVALNASVFYKVLQRFGTLRVSGEVDTGNVVGYYQTKDAAVDSVNHVAWVLEGGSSPKVITKDETQRIYIVGLSDVNSSKYVMHRVWTVPWDKLRVQVVAGPIQFDGTPTVTPAEPMVGDTVTVAFAYRVLNPPYAGMQMQEDATLVDSSGNVVGTPQRKTQSLVPGPTTSGQAQPLLGKTSFQARVTKPGIHSWILNLSATKPTSLDEAPADYEPVCKTVTFPVRARPEITDVQLSVTPEQIPEGGQGQIQVGYTIKGVPEPGRPPLRLICQAEQTRPGTTPTKSLGRSESLLNSPPSEIVVKKLVQINKAGSAGSRTVKVTLRIEANGLAPVEVTKQASYEVVKR